jgi:hypothetical protein
MVVVYANVQKSPPAQAEAPPIVKHKVEKEMVEQSLLGPSAYILTVDDCEYIVVIGGQGVGITHKANCKNLIHQEKKNERVPDAGAEKTRWLVSS